MKVLGFALAALFLLLVVGLTGASLHFYNFAIKRGPKAFLGSNPDLQATQSQAAAAPGGTGAHWVEEQDYETWEIRSHDGLKLVAYYIPAARPTTRTAIIAHGYTSRGRPWGALPAFTGRSWGSTCFCPMPGGMGRAKGIT